MQKSRKRLEELYEKADKIHLFEQAKAIHEKLKKRLE